MQTSEAEAVQSQPKVSVLVMTYNHAEYIRHALDSVLMQEVTFAYEILISEDYSTDGTREIVIDYQQRHPDRIRLLLSEENVHNNSVVARGLAAATGEYIALLDGDDYWTSKHKLQRQVDFLESHPECSLCFHNAIVVDETSGGDPWKWTPEDYPEISSLEDIWMGNFIATCSTLFRRWASGEVPEWYIDMFPITDWPLHILNAERGQIGYINEVMGVYRYHSRGYYSPMSETRKLEQTLSLFQTMNQNFDYKYNNLVNIGISKYFVEWAEEYLARGDVARARSCFRTSLIGRPINQFIPAKRLLVLMLRLFFPRVVKLQRPSLERS